MKIIKKHPIAFTQLMSFEIMGLSFLLAVTEGEFEDWYFAIAGLSFVTGALVFCVSILLGIISSIRKSASRKKGSTYNSKIIIDNLAVDYVTKSRFGAIYWIAVIVLSPITPVLLVHVLDLYFFGTMVMALGLMIWMIWTMKDAFCSHFYSLSMTKHYCIEESGEKDELLDSLYGDYAHAYREDLWDMKNEFIVNLLRHEKKLGKGVRCYKVSNKYLSKKYGFEYHQNFDNLILVPFAQFDPNGKSGAKLRYYFDRLSIVTYTDYINSKYQSKDSFDPEDYKYTEENISLVPFMTRLQGVRCSNGEMAFNLSCARPLDSIWKRYYDCLMVIKLAECEKEANPNLNFESRRITCSVDMDEKLVTLKVFNEPDEEDFSCESDEEFYDLLEKTYQYRYENIRWYWDGYCDYEKTQKLLEKVQEQK